MIGRRMENQRMVDKTSTPPMCSFPRFDLQESTYSIGLMADRTPAWREVYTEILDEIAERSITYWAAVDWLSQFGNDPNRKNYPEEWKGTLIPEEFWGTMMRLAGLQMAYLLTVCKRPYRS